MNGQQIGAGVAVSLQVTLGIGDHQVHVEGKTGDPSDRLNDGDAKAQVGDEMPVHHVEMQDLRSRLLQTPDRRFKIAEIGRQQRRIDHRRVGVQIGND
jgi:hypothetical protein